MSTIEDLSKARATFALRFPWRDRTAGTQGVEEGRLWAKHPRGCYGKFRFEDRDFLTSQESAKSAVFSARSRICFMDASGFKRSTAQNAVWACCNGPMWPRGFDYVLVWISPTHRMVVTTESYQKHLPVVEAECAARRWPYHAFEPGIGMRNPAGGTRLVLISPQGLDIGPLVQTLERALPTIETRKDETP
jgi:hypothetical protein